MKKQVKKSKRKKGLDKFHYHEALDRTAVQSATWEDYIRTHPVVEGHKKLKKLADKISNLMGELYQELGQF